MITEGQIRTAIAVLQAFIANDLDEQPDDLVCELLDAAYDAINAPGVTCDLDISPLTASA